MQSTATSVSAYLAQVPADRRAALTRLRKLCRAILTGYDETMRYGNPAYSRGGEVEVGFASQKHFIGLYILKNEVMDAHRHLLTGRGISVGKGCIRYSKPAQIDFEIVEQLLTATRDATGVICG